jgi:glyoxylase-like metal-dependent hydrolase (beta-lactamase superfamily II)
MSSLVESFRSSNGARIYRFHLELFPGISGYAHLVFTDDIVALIDVGSGFGESNAQLEEGLKEVSSSYGEKVNWKNITHVLITHGHIDHFGGLHFVRKQTSAKIGIHELDLRVLADYEARLTTIDRRLQRFLAESGVSATECQSIMALYLFNKQLFSSIPPDFTYSTVGMQIGSMQIFHVPGHCPGQVVMRLGDVLFSADHVLKSISPHLAPERLSLNTGLSHYLESLKYIYPLADGIRLTLGGHEGPIEDLKNRILEIVQFHMTRLELVLALLDEPKTIAEISHELFPDVDGYHRLLALEETGAHVEYLTQREYLRIDNPEDMDLEVPVPLRYCRLEGMKRLRSYFDVESTIEQ